MKKSTGALLGCGCIAVVVAVFMIGPASAAIVPFNGVEYSWLHHDDNGDPVADWIVRISDVAPVRNGDMMQFQNRWYNSYAGTADLRISYGGELAGICTGADESVYYGLNYGNYYPSGTSAVPFYSTVLNCSTNPLYLMVTHQYVFNGIQYGTLDPADKSLLFQWRADINDSRAIQTSPTPAPAGSTPTQKPTGSSTPTQKPTGSSTPTQKPTNGSTPTKVPLPTGAPSAAPGFGFGSIFALVAVLAIACVGHNIRRMK
jgi:hypothetical protein